MKSSREKSHDVPATSWSSSSSRSRHSSLESTNSPSKRVSSPDDFLRPRNEKPCRLASRSIPESRFAIALWLSDVTPTRRPARMSATAAFAPCHVFPEPGGPWTKR